MDKERKCIVFYGEMIGLGDVDGSAVQDVLEIALLEQLTMLCASILRRVQLFQLFVQFMKGSRLLVAGTVLQSASLCSVDLLLVLALLLFVLLNLKAVFYILLHFPSIFNGFSLRLRLDELVCLEVFEDGQKVALEYISEAVFFLNEKEGKQTVDCWKGMLVVIVADDDLRYHVFLFGL